MHDKALLQVNALEDVEARLLLEQEVIRTTLHAGTQVSLLCSHRDEYIVLIVGLALFLVPRQQSTL